MSMYRLISYAVVVTVFGSSVINADAKLFDKGKSVEKQVENDQTKEKKGIFSRIKEKRQRKSEFKKIDASESVIKSFKEQAKLLVIHSNDKKSDEVLRALYKKLENIKEIRSLILGEAEKSGFSVNKEISTFTPIFPIIQKLQKGDNLTKEDKKIIKNFNNALKKIQKLNDPKHLVDYEINFIDSFLGTENNVISDKILNNNIRPDRNTDSKSKMVMSDYNSGFASESGTHSEDSAHFDFGPSKVNDNVIPSPTSTKKDNSGAEIVQNDTLPSSALEEKKANASIATTHDSNVRGPLEFVKNHGEVKNLRETEPSASESKSSVSSRSSSSDNSSWLDDIRKGKKLKKVTSDTSKTSVDSDDIASQLSAVMSKRRQDIAPPDEYEEDDDDTWDD